MSNRKSLIALIIELPPSVIKYRRGSAGAPDGKGWYAFPFGKSPVFLGTSVASIRNRWGLR